jgi:predicted transglutaminase-like cysteine proteinase
MSTLVTVAFSGMLSVIGSPGSALAQSPREARLVEKNIALQPAPASLDIDASEVGQLSGNTAGSQRGTTVALTGSGTVSIAELALFIAVGADVRPPIGWTLYCTEHPIECDVKQLESRNVVLTNKAWAALQRINTSVNHLIKPLTDVDHWGMMERWSYPDDGYGDCEDYVLLKRRMLMRAGWPRQALLITIVHDEKGDVHAVLTVKTDKGEFILDSEEDSIMLWSQSRYHFVKRQSQSDPNVWIALEDTRPIPSNAARAQR